MHMEIGEDNLTNSTPCCVGCSVGRSVGHIFEFRVVFILLLLPNRPRLDCRVSGLVSIIITKTMRRSNFAICIRYDWNFITQFYQVFLSFSKPIAHWLFFVFETCILITKT